jgi:hypothetical protein
LKRTLKGIESTVEVIAHGTAVKALYIWVREKT